MSFQAFLETYCRDLPPEAWARATSYVEGFNAAAAERISIRALAGERLAGARIEGDRAFRILDGYDAVAGAIRRAFAPGGVALHLNTIVESVAWRSGAVEATVQPRAGGSVETYTAGRALITLPLGVLQAPPDVPGAVRFSPDLAEKRPALGQLEMGHVVKITLRFREAFWQHGLVGGRDLSRLSFLVSGGTGIPTWWSAYPVRAPLLVGWAAGTAADRLAPRGDQAILDGAVDSLARLLGAARGLVAGQLDGWYFHDWQADPFARGAYSFVRAGGAAAQAALAQPIANTLFFAGEATAEGHIGTVHGAIASGERAAREVIRSAEGKIS
jgi:monoamine oxidase